MYNKRKKRRERVRPDGRRAFEVFTTFDAHAYEVFRKLFVEPKPGRYCGLLIKKNGKQHALYRGREYLGQMKDLMELFLENPPHLRGAPAQGTFPAVMGENEAVAPLLPASTPATGAQLRVSSTPASIVPTPLMAAPLIMPPTPPAIPRTPEVMTEPSGLPPGWEEVPPPKSAPVEPQAPSLGEPVRPPRVAPPFLRDFLEKSGIKIDWAEAARLNGGTGKSS